MPGIIFGIGASGIFYVTTGQFFLDIKSLFGNISSSFKKRDNDDVPEDNDNEAVPWANPLHSLQPQTTENRVIKASTTRILSHDIQNILIDTFFSYIISYTASNSNICDSRWQNQQKKDDRRYKKLIKSPFKNLKYRCIFNIHAHSIFII